MLYNISGESVSSNMTYVHAPDLKQYSPHRILLEGSTSGAPKILIYIEKILAVLFNSPNKYDFASYYRYFFANTL